MSLRENTMDRPPVDRSQTSEPVPTDNKRTHRLYPSLPNIDTYDFCVLDYSIGEKLHTAAEFHPERQLEDTQSEVSAANSDVRMKAQILILEEQKQELISINEKWAKEYRTMVRYYKEKVQDLKALLQQSRNHFEEGTCEEGEKHTTLYKKLKFKTNKDSKSTGDGDATSELLKVEKEAKELRAQNATLTRRGQHQQKEIKRLNEALEEALLTTKPHGESSETLQDLWKHQAQVYKEDFLTERKDRERLNEKYLELQNRFRKVRTELHVLKSQVTWAPPPQPVLECVCTNRVKCPDCEDHMRLQRTKHS
ncbi:TNFAIP3-interacting protein 1-like [Toxotes jaculatrix]|uniref:TNFAIP3-interacting protein 1-like n=1 Tax=Toxotes jaculatrix TaxID=941984 RepID=UPI001B3A895A|nr:TNFAIP3-interacting protein 1-like [Toxotes jaculatrix]